MKIKKVFILLFLITSVFMLISCNKKTDTIKQKKDYLNQSEIKFYSFQFNDQNIKNELISYKVFNDFKQISTADADNTDNINMFIFDNLIYDKITRETVDGMFKFLNMNALNIIVFINFEDFSFFKNSPFQNEKDEYTNSYQFKSYYNVNGYIETHSADYEFDGITVKSSGLILLAYDIVTYYYGLK